VRRLAVLLIALVPVLASCSTGTAAEPRRIEIRLHFSHYEPTAITVAAGQPITFVLRNDDLIDHEWIVGEAALHERHRTGTEEHHDARPTEVSIDALTTPETTVTFTSATSLTFICHLPGHEAFGMVGTLTVVPSP
jgi:uncharacterized cupredoxin-like copper-binding protein